MARRLTVQERAELTELRRRTPTEAQVERAKMAYREARDRQRRRRLLDRLRTQTAIPQVALRVVRVRLREAGNEYAGAAASVWRSHAIGLRIARKRGLIDERGSVTEAGFRAAWPALVCDLERDARAFIESRFGLLGRSDDDAPRPGAVELREAYFYGRHVRRAPVAGRPFVRAIWTATVRAAREEQRARPRDPFGIGIEV